MDCRRIVRRTLNDLCSGYWAFSKQSISMLKLNSMKFEIEAEMYTSCAVEELKSTYSDSLQ